MHDIKILEGKKILVADDEPDILESLEEVLDMCNVDSVSSFETAKHLLEINNYDIAVFDIMGVDGYALLDIANKRGTPAVMLTAHALTPEDFKKSVQAGAQAYLPKEKLYEIVSFLSDILSVTEQKQEESGTWFDKLKDYYDRKFGPGWLDFSKWIEKNRYR